MSRVGAAALFACLAAAATDCASLLGIDQPEVTDDAGDDVSGSSSGSEGDSNLGSSDGGDGGDGGSGSDTSKPQGDAPGANDGTTSHDAANDDAAPPQETGTTDAPVADTSTPYDASALCSGHPGYIICDDFEEGVIDTTRWPNTAMTGGTITVDTLNAHSGTQALHVHVNDVPSGTTYLGLIQNNNLSLPSTVYARVWVLLPGVSGGASLPVQNTNYLGLLGQVSGQFWGINVGTTGNSAALTDFGMPNAFVTSTATIALDPWACVTVSVATTSASTGNISMTVGTTSVSAVDAWTAPLSQFHVGAYVPGGPQPNFDVWLDDVYVSTSPVSCSSP